MTTKIVAAKNVTTVVSTIKPAAVILTVAIHTTRQLATTALLSRNHRVAATAVHIEVVAAPALEGTSTRTGHAHVSIVAKCALSLTLLNGLHISHDVIAHTVSSVALSISGAVLVASNQTKCVLCVAVRRNQVPVLVVAILDHRHTMIVTGNHLHVTSAKLISSRTQLYRLPICTWVYLPHEVIVGPSAVVASPDVIVAVPQELAWVGARFNGYHIRITRISALSTVRAELLHKLERVSSPTRLRKNRIAVGATAIARLLVHDSIEVLGLQLVADIHLIVGKSNCIRRCSKRRRRRRPLQACRSSATSTDLVAPALVAAVL